MGKEPKSSHNVRHQPVATCNKKQVQKRGNSTIKESFICGYCHVDYVTFEKQHSHKCYPYRCPICLQIFKYDVQLIHLHLEESHSQNQFPSMRTLTCDHCDYTCRVPELLSKHKRTCHKKLQNCEKCESKLCFNEEKYCRKCWALVFDHNDYSLQRNIQLNDASSITSTSMENPSEIGNYTKSREQLPDTTSNLPSSLNSTNMNPIVQLPLIKSPVVTTERSSRLKIRSCVGDKEKAANVNAVIQNQNLIDLSLVSVNGLKETSLKRNPSIRKCLSSQSKEIDLKKHTSSVHPKEKKNNAESSKHTPFTNKSSTNQSNYPSENVVTKKRLKKKNDFFKVIAAKSKMPSNLSKTELIKKEIAANINSVAKSSARSLVIKHPLVKNTKHNVESSSEKSSSPVFSTMDLNMANVENIVNSLPDSESGILLKCSNETNTSFKCVRCSKLLKLNAGCMHFSLCKARYKKMLISMNDLIFLCIHCCLAFNDISELSKHKITCSKVSTKPSASNVNVIKNFIQNKAAYNYFCKICHYNCFSDATFKNHSCEQEIIKKKVVVYLDQPRKLDLDPQRKVPYYQCRECSRISLEMCGCRSHIKKCHCDADENNFTSLSVIYTGRKIVSVDDFEQNINVPTKKIKQEKDRNGTVYNSTSLYNRSNPSENSMNFTANPPFQELFSGSFPTANINNSAVRLNAHLNNLARDPKMYVCTCKGVPVLPNSNRKPCLKCHKKNVGEVIKKLRSTFRPKESKSRKNNTSVDQINNNDQSKNPISVGSSGQPSNSSGCFVNPQPRIFPTPPATPDNVDNQFPSCPPVVSDMDIYGSPESLSQSSLPCDTQDASKLLTTKEKQSFSLPSSLPCGNQDASKLLTAQEKQSFSLPSSLPCDTQDASKLLTTKEKQSFSLPSSLPCGNQDASKLLTAQEKQSFSLPSSLPCDNQDVSKLLTTQEKQSFSLPEGDLTNTNLSHSLASHMCMQLLSDAPKILPDTIQEVKNDPFILKYSWIFDKSDLIAIVPTYQSCTVLKYICSKCFISIGASVNEVCRHMQLNHNQTDGDIIILYSKSVEKIS